MLKINLPQNILGKEQYLSLHSSQKGEYIHNLLKKFLDLNPDGLTVSQIDKATYIGRSTIWHHLEILASRGDCMRMDQGDTEVYHSNNVIAPLKELDIEGEYYNYWFHLVENTYGKFIRVQAKQQDKSGSIVSYSGVLINLDLVPHVINSLARIKEDHLNEEPKSQVK